MKICSVSGCGRHHESKGLCKSHAQRLRLGKPLHCVCGEPIPLIRGSHLDKCLECKGKDSACCIDGCSSQIFQRGFCQKHYARHYRGTLGESLCLVCGIGIESHYMDYCGKHRLQAKREASRKSSTRRRTAIKLSYSKREVFELDRGVCYLCQNKVLFEEGHVDHIHPLSKGGHDAVYNVAVVHRTCNLKKNATLVKNLKQKFPSMIIPERATKWEHEQT